MPRVPRIARRIGRTPAALPSFESGRASMRAPFRITAGPARNRRVARHAGGDSGRAVRVAAAAELSQEEIKAGLARLKYFTTTRVETAIFLAVRLGKPLLAEGPAGAGKTEIGKVLASLLDTEL